MEYPIWNLFYTGGGFWVALISVVHVYVAHFAVGGGLFLVLTEYKAVRENTPAIWNYLKRHTQFFLLLTMVFGGLTGVGIWFTIQLLAPRTTSLLIHTFVFGWATEWVFFVGEIVALLLMYYGFERMRRRDHLIASWLYFIFAWGSLFVITGIIDFMLTPGGWPQSRDFWDAFFNPSLVPSLFFRTFLAFTIAGIFGFLTATRLGDDEARLEMVRYSAKWAAPFTVLTVLAGWWYVKALPAAQQATVTSRAFNISTFFDAFVWISAAVLLLALLLAVRMPQRAKTPMAALLLVIGLGQIGAFEFVREAGRKPWLVWEVMYANEIKADEAAGINQAGVLSRAKWVEHKKVTDDNLLDAGREIYTLECQSCHSIGGPMKDILPRTEKFTEFGMNAMITGIGRVNTYMPPFMGTEDERRALAAYITRGLHGKDPGPYQGRRPGDGQVETPDIPVSVPEFNPETDEYVLLSWNNLGMHCISDSDPWWVLLPPANDLFAQLVKRTRPTPTVITQGVTISYEVQPEFADAQARSRFWKYAKQIFAEELEPNVGLAGKGLSGEMDLNENGVFESKLIPVVPYPSERDYNPYPLFTITATDDATGEVLARTKVVAPTSTEMGCRNCHGGEWMEGGVAGISDATARDVLRVHDRMSRTDLLAQAEAGNPRLCQSCHPDPVLGAEGRPGLLNLPAALHGLHANYLTNRGAEACHACHPNRPGGPTRCLRGTHGQAGIDCTRCHGTMEEHALSLLKREKENGKPGAARLMTHLETSTVADASQVNPRTPWVQEPDCLTCHQDYTRPDPATANAFNTWTETGEDLFRNSMDDMFVLSCVGCHNSPHATYPTLNPYGKDRDNIQPLQYQGIPRSIGADGNCTVCHPGGRQFSAHHPNMVKSPAP
jgi:cytochrome bd-type quinol oxidase subunit 1